ncbi:TIGR03084 family metal-binding protein [Actinoplanes rectilineatus]|uniref:TIGR03084 family metal-binding protein n=1 Tax=Actinoplanes rectilineatus TaxID=113571 RepID=UPI0005F2EE5C|nr:TIGR03084 family metal-binding protein [Actinoplanes rectilineatus]
MSVVADLITESDRFDRLFTAPALAGWERPTPAPGWQVRHQYAHLTSVFRLGRLAVTDPGAFRDTVSRYGPDFDAVVEGLVAEIVDRSPEVLLSQWRTERAASQQALAASAPDRPVPWLARPLPVSLLASAAQMELFAHGQDLADTLGVVREPTDRLRHVVAFAMTNHGYGWTVRDRTPPDVPFRFELTAPSGAVWTYGPAGADQRVTGPVQDFCLLVTRRRHRDDVALTVTGEIAGEWLTVAQAYRGGTGAGRRPGQFAGPRVSR